ncbi:LuxR family transcriptional regulator [Silicimonas algicola]|uniref:LuxR family transcriptional regulator n=1 Tax=Silicimonas algicola TaxID=1826607 RepID=A0A316G7C4_9RHOB|nr:helix-turn-helix transcriptional regulator [Silicimonas algicola]AZQ67199.1 LuxR family transcriptional regulator [Silicimonas algicola]PWK56859.1 LuxR family transcriptional regulator [Silicimonas algicola]
MDTRDGSAPISSRLGPTLKVLDGIAGWCGGLHGSMPLKDALATLASGLGADAAAITRHNTNEDRPRTVAVYDAREGDPDVPLLRRGLCRDAMGYLYPKVRASTAWFLTDLLTDRAWAGTDLLENWRISRDVAEIVSLPLAIDARRRDFIELHFSRGFTHFERLEFEALVPTLVRSWAGRKPGLVTGASMDDRMIAARRIAAQVGQIRRTIPVLDASNPANLSRAEFRVCLLLSRGLSVKAVTDELGLSEATVRTHLRSIYSKTETTGMPELLFRILSPATETAQEKRRAIAG